MAKSATNDLDPRPLKVAIPSHRTARTARPDSVHSGNAHQRRRFARAVGPDDGNDLARANFDRNALKHLDRAVAGMQVVDFQLAGMARFRPGDSFGMRRSGSGWMPTDLRGHETQSHAHARPWAWPHHSKRILVRFFLSQVGGDDVRVGSHFGGRSFGNLRTVVEHRDPIGNAHHDVHVMLDQ